MSHVRELFREGHILLILTYGAFRAAFTLFKYPTRDTVRREGGKVSRNRAHGNTTRSVHWSLCKTARRGTVYAKCSRHVLSTTQRGCPVAAVCASRGNHTRRQRREPPRAFTALTPTSSLQARGITEGLLLLQSGDGPLEHRMGE